MRYHVHGAKRKFFLLSLDFSNHTDPSMSQPPKLSFFFIIDFTLSYLPSYYGTVLVISSPIFMTGYFLLLICVLVDKRLTV